MRSKLTLLVLSLLLVPALAFAGVTGKIRGKVSDKDSKEGLVGANVSVEGTSYGASTDINGEYTIVSVPAGTYNIKTSFVGYGPVTYSNVQVNADLTTSLDFSLSSQAVALAGVEIIAERPLVNKSATNAVRVVTGAEIANIPVRGISALVALQAGVVEQGGRLYVRGGRSDEVGFYIDGADARNPVSGAPLVQIVPEALEEFQVQAGGYNAEYGGANAGIVRQQLKTGSSEYKASLRAETDNLVDRGKQFLGGYAYGYSDYALTFGGPIVGDQVKFFLAGQRTWQADPAVVFWDGFTFNNLVEDIAGSNPNPNRPGLLDTLNLNIPAGNVPGGKLDKWAGNGTLTFDFNPIIVRLSGTMNIQKSIYNPTPIRNIFNQTRLPRVDQSSGLFSAKLTHFVQPNTSYDLTVSYGDSRYKRYDPIFKDDYLAYGDSIRAAAAGLPTYFRRDLSPQDVRTNGFPFSRPGSLTVLGGGANSDYAKNRQNFIGASLDLTHQLQGHEIKVGGSYQRYTIRQFTFSRMEGMLGTLLSNPDAARNGGSALDLLFRTGGLPSNFGYDIYGREINSGFDDAKHPKYFSGYLQDKFEFNDLIINAGLRFDSFDNDDREFIDQANPGFDPNNFTVLESSTRKVKPFKTVSPRLGFSFPVTDRTVFHVQYGKFVQAPQLNALYVGNSELARIFNGRNFIAVPYGFGLEPERTTQYEIGFTQQFTDFASFDITTFYKDIIGQIQARRVTTTSGSAAQSYNILQNGDFATTKGFEFTVRIRRINRIQAAVNYTLSDAQGTGSTLNSAIASAEQGSFNPTVISPLLFNQAHRGTINIDYRFGKDDGGPVLERLGANLLFSFNSGHNFTKALASSAGGQRGPEEGAFLADDDPRTRRPDGSLNSNTTPWVFNFDLKIDKTVSIANLFEVNFYVYVQNVLNTKNVLNVYARTGNAEDDGFLTNPDLSSKIIAAQSARYVELYKAINLANRQHYWQDQLYGGGVSYRTNPLGGGDLFYSPRQIRFGVNINY